MSRKSDLPQSRHHILVYDEDWEWLENHFGQYSQSRIGTGVAIRKIIHRHVKWLQEQGNIAVKSREAEAEPI